MKEPRVVHLIERRTRRCRLRRDDLDFLLAHCSRQIEVQFTAERGLVRLTPRGCVGTLIAPTCRFEIAPKMPLGCLVKLLDLHELLTIPPGAGSIVELLAGQFAQRLEERLARGLRRDYVEQTERLPHLRGRLDLAAQWRAPVADRLHCRFDELTLDTPWNRQLKAVAGQVARSPVIASDIQTRLRMALAGLRDIGECEPNAETLSAALQQPKLADDRGLFELARLMLGVSTSFLIDLEQAFEQFVTRGLLAACAGSDLQIDVQPWTRPHQPAPGQPELRLRPDLVVRRGERTLAVIDAKWKRLRPGPAADDLHQVLAYAVSLGANLAFLVYPGGRSTTWDYRWNRSDLRLTIDRLSLGQRQNWADRLRRDCQAALPS